MSAPETVMPPADLASAFGASDRSAGLQGLSRRPVTRPSPDGAAALKERGATPAKDNAVAPAVPATPAAPAAPRRRARQATDTEGSPQRSVTVYVRRNLRTEVNQERNGAAAAGEVKTNAGIVLQAVEEVLPVIDGLVEAEQRPAASGLFSHHERTVKEPGVQLGMRLSSADLAILDQLAEEHCAGNRSHLVEHALAYRYRQGSAAH